jgi:hypothetical protein
MNNLHKLFYMPHGESLSSRLRVDPQLESQLRGAAALLARELRTATSRMADSLGLCASLCTPTFRAQGSFVYGTTISPVTPSHRLDLDIGLYLPEEFVLRLGGSGPNLVGDSSRRYFEFIDGLLTNISQNFGLVYSKSEQRPHCCRIFLGAQRTLHVDVPIYVIADSADTRLGAKLYTSNVERSLGVRSPLLASRDGAWRESDVRISTRRFASALSRMCEPGSMLRLWRFLKAWRDFTWQGAGGPPSIVLMELSTRALTSAKGVHQVGCDDLVLQRVFREFATRLKNPVLVRWGGGIEDLSRDASSLVRREWAFEAERAADRLEQARYSTNWAIATELLVQVFGPRVGSESDRSVSDRTHLDALVASYS